MKKVAAILFLSLCASLAFAQEYIIDFPKKKKNDFATGLITVLNQVPAKFADLKDKPAKADETHPSLKAYKIKSKLPGAYSGKYYEDVHPFVEYNFGVFEVKDDAEAAYVKLANMIGDAMNKKVLYRNNDTGNGMGILRETKIAYAMNSGVFGYNIFVQLCQKSAMDKFSICLKIVGGTPAYYYKVIRNEPINSFTFVTAVKSQVEVFQAQEEQGCIGSIPPFICKGKRTSGDSVMVIYEKCGFEYLPDAKKEFEANLSNLRVSLNDEYVYCLVQPHDTYLREVYFMRFDDVEKEHYKSIRLSLVQRAKSDYILELAFIY